MVLSDQVQISTHYSQKFNNFMNIPKWFRPPKSVPLKMPTGVAGFLRSHEQLSPLLPTITRLDTLYQDCKIVLAPLLQDCSILKFEAGQLTIATPNAAIASKLKQQLPKLQAHLMRRGWQVDVIKLKIIFATQQPSYAPSKQIVLSNKAMSSLSTLVQTLEPTKSNASLRIALQNMLKHHKE